MMKIRKRLNQKGFTLVELRVVFAILGVLGVTALNDSNVNIRVLGETKPMKQWEAERELMKKIKLEFDKRGIEIPYNKVQVINNN